ncbi:unnamed protein product [Ambrosiozyma monospora]|uniref:Unnamed protein product n=1 Tax=Ambrosiozyma monospora TaxID=43982 RepID=A0A9W6Z1X1_AMBMO|nr:unnamed protein product [Ambrosiozyma monospora]
MYAKAFFIDTFTFDDFYAALKWNDPDTVPSLLTEVFCALFKAFMDEQGNMLINLPKVLKKPTVNAKAKKFKSKDEDDEEEEQEENEKDDEAANGDDKSEDKKDKADSDAKTEDGKAKEEDEEMEDADGEADDEEEDDDSEDEEEDEEDIQHNAYSILEFKKTSWKDRLAKRQFKDGGWIMVLIGLLTTIEYINAFKNDITKTYEILAPGDYNPTLETLHQNFMVNADINLRAKLLAMLINVLLNGAVVRAFIEKGIEDSANLRRERLDAIKELKLSIEEAQTAAKEVQEHLKTVDIEAVKARLRDEKLARGETDPLVLDPPEKKKKGGRPMLNVLPPEPSELEKAICISDPKFMNLIKVRTEKIKVVDGFKQKKKELEKQLNEIDVQRVKFVGRDRMYNRYWWFERNGLPNLSASVERDDDEEEDDAESIQAIDDEEEEKYIAETYLMGRLWVQGPADVDRLKFLRFDDEQLTKWRGIYDETEVKTEEEKQQEETNAAANGDKSEDKMDVDGHANGTSEPVDPNANTNSTDILLKRNITPAFANASKEVLGYAFEEGGEVKDTKGNTVLNKFGSAMGSVFSPMQRKVLEEGPDILLSSADWRYIEKPEDIDRLMKWLNHNGEREKLLKKEMVELQDQIKNSLSSRVKSLNIGRKSDEEIQLEKFIAETDPDAVEEPQAEADATNDETEDSILEGTSEDEDKPRTRRSARQGKRKREESVAERRSKRPRRGDKPSQRVTEREAKRRRERERQLKLQKIEEAKERLEILRNGMETQNLLNWINSSAIEKFGYSHYLGPKVAAKNSSRNKRKGKRGGRR